MHIIEADFRRFSDIAVPTLFGAIGVYVLWRGQAVARPSYIGEGNILSRLVTHHGNLPNTFDGFAAVLSRPGISPQKAKANAEIVEAILLWVSHQTDRAPSANRAPGKLMALDSIFRNHGRAHKGIGNGSVTTARGAPLIRGTKLITPRYAGAGQPDIKYDWRLRKVRM